MSRGARYCAQQVITRHGLNHKNFDRLRDARQHCIDQGWRNWGIVKLCPDSGPFQNDGRRVVSQTSDTTTCAYLEEIVQAINQEIDRRVAQQKATA